VPLSRNLGTLTSWNPLGHSRPVTGQLYLFLIIITIIIIIISFMQGIYTYIPETNNIPREYIVAAILLLFMLPISLVLALALVCFYVSTFRSMCAVPNMAVFCSSLTSWFPGMLLTYFINDFEIVPVASIIIIIIIIIISISISISIVIIGSGLSWF
jgi:hypothetical protein